jgi:hypothetical protein
MYGSIIFHQRRTTGSSRWLDCDQVDLDDSKDIDALKHAPAAALFVLKKPEVFG